MLRNQRRTSPASASRCHPPHRGRAKRAAQRRPYKRSWTELPPLSLFLNREAAWFSRVNLPSPSGLSNSVAKRPILPQAKLPQLLNEPGRAQRARRRSSLVSSSRAVAHSCRRDQPARIQRIPVRRCRRPACAVADASETMPPKIPFHGFPEDNPSDPLCGPPTGACRPVLAEKCPPDISPGARTPLHRGA